MDQRQKLNYFNSNIRSILADEDNDLISFIAEIENIEDIQIAISNWPLDLKLKMVDRFIAKTRSDNVKINKRII